MYEVNTFMFIHFAAWCCRCFETQSRCSQSYEQPV